jgi:hypothetical protein
MELKYSKVGARIVGFSKTPSLSLLTREPDGRWLPQQWGAGTSGKSPSSEHWMNLKVHSPVSATWS